jgi:hypothetical protein
MIFRTLLPKARLGEAIELAERIELDVKKPYGRLSTGNRRKTNLITAEFSVKPAAATSCCSTSRSAVWTPSPGRVFEEIWRSSAANVLRLVSCHPDYDSMEMPSALMIEGKTARHSTADGQTWSQLKNLLN